MDVDTQMPLTQEYPPLLFKSTSMCIAIVGVTTIFEVLMSRLTSLDVSFPISSNIIAQGYYPVLYNFSMFVHMWQEL